MINAEIKGAENTQEFNGVVGQSQATGLNSSDSRNPELNNMEDKTETDAEYFKKIKHNLRHSKFRLPYVVNNTKLGQTYIIYSNRVEMYGTSKGFIVQTKAELDKLGGWDENGWTPEIELEMALDVGFKRVFIPLQEDLIK